MCFLSIDTDNTGQVNYYKSYIQQNPIYELVGIYADEGISGTNTKKREEFNRMIADCRAHKIQLHGGIKGTFRS